MSDRPRVICHMMASVDGRIVVSGWPLSDELRAEYDSVHESYEADGWMCGRITMEPFAKRLRSDAEIANEMPGHSGRDDYAAPGVHDSFAFAVDASGRLAWESNDIGGDHVVTILSNRVSDEYLAFLRERKVSYILAGAMDMDLPVAMEKIGRIFGVKTLMLEGGGKINGTMLRSGLIDELSLLIAPVADGRVGMPSLFDIVEADRTPGRMVLEQVERRASNIVWLRYRIDASGRQSRG
jgi:2,5-diamino-6-(ribosylamino)-4(3H)-pyrimidinone 5'-phosphate reductase